MSEARGDCCADISSEFSLESPGSSGNALYHEPSLSANIDDLGTQDGEGGGEAAEVEAPRVEQGWARTYLAPLGMLGKAVFGRKNSGNASSASDSESGKSASGRGGKAVQALNFESGADEVPPR
jgi:hypothetical protein